MRWIFLMVLSLFCGLAAAQVDGDANRGSTPPGLSQDGARPAEGAIKGGSIAPGESGGMPQKSPDRPAASGGTSSKTARCYQLEGTLREQCLQKLNKESATQR
jgi:hypothetical protein